MKILSGFFLFFCSCIYFFVVLYIFLLLFHRKTIISKACNNQWDAKRNITAKDVHLTIYGCTASFLWQVEEFPGLLPAKLQYIRIKNLDILLDLINWLVGCWINNRPVVRCDPSQILIPLSPFPVLSPTTFSIWGSIELISQRYPKGLACLTKYLLT